MTKERYQFEEELINSNDWNFIFVSGIEPTVISQEDFLRVATLLWENQDGKIVNITNGHKGEVITSLEQFILNTDKPVIRRNGIDCDYRRENLQIIS